MMDELNPPDNDNDNDNDNNNNNDDVIQPVLFRPQFSMEPVHMVVLTHQEVSQIRELLATLAPALTGMESCWSDCVPPSYQLRLGPDTTDLILVSDSLVLRGKKTFADVNRALSNYLAPLMRAAATIRASSTKKPCTTLTKPLLTPCDCGGPDDFDQWVTALTLLNNSCYNFALKNLWCDGGGAYPLNAPNGPNMERWDAALKAEGCVPVRHWDDAPKGSTPADGWIIALAVQPRGPGHFLRLDEHVWSHKMATLAPQTCDVAGNPIHRDGILAANLCDYVVRGFYWVPVGLQIKLT